MVEKINFFGESINLSKENLNMQKYKVLAEVNYFTYSLTNAFKYDKCFLKSYYMTYSSGTLSEHLAAYTFAAVMNHSEESAKDFYNELIQLYNNNIQSKLRLNLFVKKVNEQIEILNRSKTDIFRIGEYIEPEIYFDSDEFIKKFVNSFKGSMKESANPLLNQFLFLYQYSYPEDFIRYYENYEDLIQNDQYLHINAAKVYKYLNRPVDACNALKKYVQLCVSKKRTPMSLFLYNSLYDLYTPDFFKNILIEA